MPKTCGIKGKKITQHRDSNSHPLNSTGPQIETHHGNRPIVSVGIPSHPELGYSDLLHFLPGPYPPPPYYFWEVIISLHIALTFDFPPFHGRGTRDEGDQDTAGEMPFLHQFSLSCLFSFLLSPDFH